MDSAAAILWLWSMAIAAVARPIVGYWTESIWLVPAIGNLLVAAIVLAGWIARWLWNRHGLDSELARWERKNRGYCACCGYDLRATPKRCPECGMWVENPG